MKTLMITGPTDRAWGLLGELAMYYNAKPSTPKLDFLERKMNRHEQIALLIEWAQNMIERQPTDVDSTAEEIVSFWINETEEFYPLPEWFDEHDYQLLIRYVQEQLEA